MVTELHSCAADVGSDNKDRREGNAIMKSRNDQIIFVAQIYEYIAESYAYFSVAK